MESRSNELKNSSMTQTRRAVISGALISLVAISALKPVRALMEDGESAPASHKSTEVHLSDYGPDFKTQEANITARLNRIRDAEKSSARVLSDDDVSWMMGIVNASDADYGITGEVLNILLMRIGGKMAPPKQYWNISNTLYKLLTTPDDPKVDKQGLAKFWAILAVRSLTPEKRFINPIYALIQDKRAMINENASRIYVALQTHYYGNDGGVKVEGSLQAKNANEARLASIEKSCKKSKNISDNDLEFLLTEAGITWTTADAASKYLAPLLALDPKGLTSTQKDEIGRHLQPLLVRDDRATDPMGVVKQACCAVVSFTLPDSRFEQSVKPLRNDSRELVKVAAEEALAAIENQS